MEKLLTVHNRYGYQDAFDVAEVVYNYSKAEIPLETMWTDIDYMDRRRTFSLDTERYSLNKVQEIVSHLHKNNQHYIVMVDPAVAYQDYAPMHRGLEQNAFLLRSNGSVWLGVVWPGVTVFPDWFAKNADAYWTGEFKHFFDKNNGVDIDGLWIDMNEPSNFPCNFPCDNPYEAAKGFPPPAPALRQPPRSLPGWSCEFQPEGCKKREAIPEQIEQESRDFNTDALILPERRADANGDQKGLPGRDLLYPKYSIHNKAAFRDDWNGDKGGISNHTVNTDLISQNGLAMYDTHNLYGSLMSIASQRAMEARRPGLRPLIITRSTYAGAGAKVGHWLGDNFSTWQKYRESIRGMLAFTSLFQFNMVGSDVCGFAGTSNEALCARWASLGAFYTFYRNHNEFGTAGQEFYRWPLVTQAAKKAIDIRYRLLDYMYTAMHKANKDGTPALSPVFYYYPDDAATFGLDLQYFYGPGLMVAPVTEEGSTSVSVYLPEDNFYDWYTHKLIPGGKTHTFTNVSLTDIPLLIRSGVIMPLRLKSGMTTAEVRKQDFELIIPLDEDQSASGELYIDDGVSIVQKDVTDLKFQYKDGKLSVKGTFGVQQPFAIRKVTILGEDCKKRSVSAAKKTGGNPSDKTSRTVEVNISLNQPSTITV